MDETDRRKKRQAFIDKHKHELAGLILDGATFNRTGGELALWARGIMHRCDQRLGHIFDDMFPGEEKPIPPLSEADKAKLEAERKQGGKK